MPRDLTNESAQGLLRRIEALAEWHICIVPLRGPVMSGERWVVTGTNTVAYVQTYIDGLEHAEAFMAERTR